MAPELIDTALELNLPRPDWELRQKLNTPAVWWAKKFPAAFKQYGCPFLEMRKTSCDGFPYIPPASINVDFFAAMLGGDAALGHSVVYVEGEMEFYYLEPVLNIYKPTTPEKLQNYYRAMMLRCAQELGN